jgi:hypothetical protein
MLTRVDAVEKDVLLMSLTGLVSQDSQEDVVVQAGTSAGRRMQIVGHSATPGWGRVWVWTGAVRSCSANPERFSELVYGFARGGEPA